MGKFNYKVNYIDKWDIIPINIIENLFEENSIGLTNCYDFNVKYRIENLFFKHAKSIIFLILQIDPKVGAYIQHVEGMLSVAKHFFMPRHFTSKELFDSYLCEFMWW